MDMNYQQVNLKLKGRFILVFCNLLNIGGQDGRVEINKRKG